MNVEFLGPFFSKFKSLQGRLALEKQCPQRFQRICQPRYWQPYSPLLTAPHGEVNATDTIVISSFYRYYNKNFKLLDNYLKFSKLCLL